MQFKQMSLEYLKSIFLITLLIFFLGILFGEVKEYGMFKNVEFVRCYDGDTCTFNIPGLHPLIGDKISVRISGVNTPEIRGKCPREKALARKAKTFAQGKLSESRSIEIRHIKRGKFFRIIGEISVDGMTLSELIIRQGLEVAYNGGKRSSWCEPKGPFSS